MKSLSKQGQRRDTGYPGLQLNSGSSYGWVVLLLENHNFPHFSDESSCSDNNSANSVEINEQILQSKKHNINAIKKKEEESVTTYKPKKIIRQTLVWFYINLYSIKWITPKLIIINYISTVSWQLSPASSLIISQSSFT